MRHDLERLDPDRGGDALLFGKARRIEPRVAQRLDAVVALGERPTEAVARAPALDAGDRLMCSICRPSAACGSARTV
ncbi:MAG: hypothetical protein SNJ73_09270 [Acetobacteraceae bacterium]